MLKSFRKIRVKDFDLNSLQDNVANSLAPILKSPIIDGTLITNVSVLAASETKIPHPLGRIPLGWIVVDNTAAASVYRPVAADFTTTTITLRASADTTISIWVF